MKLNLIAWTLESPFPFHTSISRSAFDYNLEEWNKAWPWYFKFHRFISWHIRRSIRESWCGNINIFEKGNEIWDRYVVYVVILIIDCVIVFWKWGILGRIHEPWSVWNLRKFLLFCQYNVFVFYICSHWFFNINCVTPQYSLFPPLMKAY